MFNGARVVGPAVAGVLVAAVGEGWCFFANAVSYIAVIAGLLLMRVPPIATSERPASMLAHVTEGFRFVLRSRPISALLLLLGLVSLMGTPYSVLMPIIADQTFHAGSRGLGILMGAAGVGALIGALSLARRVGLKGYGRSIGFASIAFGLSMIAFSFMRQFWLGVLFLLPAGFAMMTQMAASNTLVQSMTPNSLRGRVMAVYSMMFMGMAPIGALLAGTLAGWLGATTTVGLGGAFCLLGGAVFLNRLPTIREEARRLIRAQEQITTGPTADTARSRINSTGNGGNMSATSDRSIAELRSEAGGVAAPPSPEDTRLFQEVRQEIGKVIVGQHSTVERLLTALLADGHVLLEGVPGLAKTLAVRTLATTITGVFHRIQFTPDLLPSDLIGTMIYNQRSGDFTVQQGPIFANILLADEINRSPAKVQSALLEAMQEKQVTIGGQTFPLPDLFLVLATQNPIEHEGTYPLPEAQVDRFMFKLLVSYPVRAEEREVLDRMTTGAEPEANPVLDPESVIRARRAADLVYVDGRIKDYVLDVVGATRQPQLAGLQDLAPMIEYGASPRAAIFLIRAAKAHAFLQGRGYVIPEDIKALGLDVLRHRLLLTYRADAEGLTPDEVLRRIFENVAVP